MESRRIYCLVPIELAGRLHDSLRRHFRDDPEVEVVIEQRHRDRRAGTERRADTEAASRRRGGERRKVRSPSGRRIADRRAVLVPMTDAEAPTLPRRAERHADHIIFVERVALSAEKQEDADTARLVTRIQAGEEALFTELYMRYFDRVYAYLHALLRNSHEAEDMTQQVFMHVFEALPRYERRRQPFRAWLFTVVRNRAIQHLRKHGRLRVADEEEIARRRDAEPRDDARLEVLDWISDHDLSLFVERLPLPQRQVLLMRFMLDLTTAEIGQVLGRSPNEVAVLQYRAVGFLRQRMAAVGRRSAISRGADPMRRWVRPARVLRRRRFALNP
jgi:RNA polymerase sigma-70 factor (ECF subfamily)